MTTTTTTPVSDPTRRFLVYKRSLLRGRFPRILEISSRAGIKSLDPTRGNSPTTNEWTWEQVVNCEYDPPDNGFKLTVLNSASSGAFSSLLGGQETLHFETENKPKDLLAWVFACMERNSQTGAEGERFEAEKFRMREDGEGRRMMAVMGFAGGAIRLEGDKLSVYEFNNVNKFGALKDGLYFEIGHGRVKVFRVVPKAFEIFVARAIALGLKSSRKDETDKSCEEFALLWATRHKTQVTKSWDTIWSFSTLCEKISHEKALILPRTLRVFSKPNPRIEEWNGDTRVSVRTLTREDVLEYVACPSDQPMTICVRFADGLRTYVSMNRDELGCALLDACEPQTPRLFAGSHVVTFQYTYPSHEASVVAFYSLATSIQLLNAERSESFRLAKCYSEFNANSLPDAFNSSLTEPYVADRVKMSIISLVFARELAQRPTVPNRSLVDVCESLSRFVRFSTQVAGLTSIPPNEICSLGVLCLQRSRCDDFVVRAFFQILFSLCSTSCQDTATAYAYRSACVPGLLKSMEFVLEECTAKPRSRGPFATVSLVSDVLYPLIVSERDCTPPETYGAVMQLLCTHFQRLILFCDVLRSCPESMKRLTMILMRVFEFKLAEGFEEHVLSSGLWLEQFHAALYGATPLLRTLGRTLIALWTPAEFPRARDLLTRIVPSGLVHALDVPLLDVNAREAIFAQDEMEDVAFRNFVKTINRIPRCGVPATTSSNIPPQSANWEVFFHLIQQDHMIPDLIWNDATRRDLKVAIEHELAEYRRSAFAFSINSSSMSSSAATYSSFSVWNHFEFCVEYPSLAHEIRLGDCYVRLLLGEDDATSHRLVRQIRDPSRLFHTLFLDLIQTTSEDRRVECLKALRLVATVHATIIGTFSESMTLVDYAKESIDRRVADWAFLLLRAICENVENVKLMARGDVLKVFDLVLNRVNEIFDSNDQDEETPDVIKEWYVKFPDDAERQGPFLWHELKQRVSEAITSIDVTKIRFWTLNFKDWQYPQSVHQLRREFVMKSKSNIDKNTIAMAGLEILQKFVRATPAMDENGRYLRPAPKAIRSLCSREYLFHVSKMLLAYNYPRVMEETASLLTFVATSCPEFTRKLYLTGAFFFLLGYGGSNFTECSGFLFETHFEQHFTEEAITPSTPLAKRSVLGGLLPEAMLFLLSNSSRARFAKVLVGGETDDPEVIWTADMRKQLTDAMETHLDGFVHRLKECRSLVFDFVPAPPIAYRRLENETYCSRYYLGNLCDVKFSATWPVEDPVGLLKAVLDVWRDFEYDDEIANDRNESGSAQRARRRVTKKDALMALGFEEFEEAVTEARIKSAWRKLAREFHPDRNPAGRKMFESIQEAYELLIVNQRSSFRASIDPVTLLSILKCQILLTERFGDALSELRYPCFPLLVKLLQCHLPRAQANSQSLSISESAAHLMYRVCWVSHLNAIELLKHMRVVCECTLIGLKMLRSKQQEEHREHVDIGFVHCMTSISNDLMKIVAGLSELSDDSRGLLIVENELCDELCRLPTDPRTSDDVVRACLRAFSSDMGHELVSTTRLRDFLKSVARVVLRYDQTSFGQTETLEITDSLSGCPPGLVRNELCRLAVSALLARGKDILSGKGKRVFPPSLLSLIKNEQSFDVFCHAVVHGYESLTVFWTPKCANELKSFSENTKDGEDDWPIYEDLARELVVSNEKCSFYVRVFVEQKSRFSVEEGFTTALVTDLKERIIKNPADSFVQLGGSALTMVCCTVSAGNEAAAHELLTSMTKSTIEILMRGNLIDPLIAFATHHALGIPRIVLALRDCRDILISSLRENRTGVVMRHQLDELICRVATSHAGRQFILDDKRMVFSLFRVVILFEDIVALRTLIWCSRDDDSSLTDRLERMLVNWIPQGLVSKLLTIENIDDESVVDDAERHRVRQFFASIENIEFPRLIWNEQCSRELHAFLNASGTDENSILEYETLKHETKVGGVYLRVFLVDPNMPFEESETFLDAVVALFLAECMRRTAAVTTVDTLSMNVETSLVQATTNDDPIITPLCSAIVALCTSRPGLCSRVSIWGNAALFVELLTRGSPLGHEVAGALRVISVVLNDSRCLRSFTAVSGEFNFANGLISIIVNVSPDEEITAVASETIRSALNASDMEGSRSFAESMLVDDFALSERLLKVLFRDPDSAKHRVHTIESLRTLESRFGSEKLSETFVARFPDWAKLRSQRHDLFLSSRDSVNSAVFLLKGPAESVKADESMHPLLLTSRPRAGSVEALVWNDLNGGGRPERSETSDPPPL